MELLDGFVPFGLSKLLVLCTGNFRIWQMQIIQCITVSVRRRIDTQKCKCIVPFRRLQRLCKNIRCLKVRVAVVEVDFVVVERLFNLYEVDFVMS